jgi:hypothetical protein
METETEVEVAAETVAIVNDENGEKRWRRWKRCRKWKIIGTDSEGMVSDDDLNRSEIVCRVFLI